MPVADSKVLSIVDILEPTVFGPLIGTLVEFKEDLLSDVKYVLTVPEDGVVVTKYFSLNCNDECNWMKFVRLAKEPSEANLIVFQQRGSVYFSTIKPVRAGEELVVSYSTHYARTVEEATKKGVDIEPSRISARSFVPSQTVAYRRPPSPLREPPLLLNLLPTIPTLPNFLPDEQGWFSVMCRGFGAIKQHLFCFRSLLPVGYGYSSTRTG